MEKVCQQHSGIGPTLPASAKNNVEATEDEDKLFADIVTMVQQESEDSDWEHWERLATRCGGTVTTFLTRTVRIDGGIVKDLCVSTARLCCVPEGASCRNGTVHASSDPMTMTLQWRSQAR
jgi:hypothetical protein